MRIRQQLPPEAGLGHTPKMRIISNRGLRCVERPDARPYAILVIIKKYVALVVVVGLKQSLRTFAYLLAYSSIIGITGCGVSSTGIQIY